MQSAAPTIPEEEEKPEWAPKDLSTRHMMMCEYRMAGMKHSEIGALLGYHPVYVGRILSSPAAKKYIAQRIQDIDDELHGQYHQVVENMRTALLDESVDVRMRATELWMKAHGKFARAGAQSEERVSAEEVVQKLLERAASVNINIDNRSVHHHRDRVEPPPTLDNMDAILGPDDE